MGGAEVLERHDTSMPAPSTVPGGRGGGTPPPRLVSRRVRRNRSVAGLLLATIAVAVAFVVQGGSGPAPASQPGTDPPPAAGNARLAADWDGDGHAITLVFAGDTNFPAGSLLGDRLAADPTTALGPGVRQLLSHSQLSMVNFESALTSSPCPVPQPKEFVFDAPATALTAFKAAGATLVTEANNHGMDCGRPGLLQALTIRARARYRVIGIGANAAAAFASYQTVLDGEHVGIIAATQVIDDDLVGTWTATATQPGLASAYVTQALVNAVKAARRVDDTVVVFLHWGIQLDACPDPIQEPLAGVLVRAGADIVIGSHAHVLLGGGYLGTAFVDYGLGNFAFYNDPSPTNYSGALAVTITGRHVDAYSWRPAIVENELPVPVTGAAAREVQARFIGARSCTNLTARPTPSLSSPSSEDGGVSASILHELS